MRYISLESVSIGVIIIICAGLFLLFMRQFKRDSKKRLIPPESMQGKELLGPKEWEQQMINLSRNHKNVKWMKYNFIVGNYNQEAYKKLNQIRSTISGISSDIISLIPSARWLFDNFQMMYREIKKVKTTGTNYETLPVLRTGEFKAFPRIYVVARKMVELSGGYLNEENIILMLKAYQKELPLTNKELWALPEMIGLCLLENIIEVAEEIIRIIKIKAKADKFVKDRLSHSIEDLDLKPLLHKVPGDCHENASFHSHVIYLMKNMYFEDEAIQRYISFHCRPEGKSINPSEVFKEEGKLESILESNIRTLIVSLREINQIDEESLFEELSLLEHILSKDPEGVYPLMDTESRGMYRGIIEKFSYRRNIPEGLIGEACLNLAIEGRDDLSCSHHVGTYLLGKGFPLLKARVLRKTPPEINHSKKNLKGFFYFIICTLCLFLLYFLLTYVVYRYGKLRETYQYSILFLVSLPLILQIALEITNNIITRIVPVQKIPSLDYLKEIPDSARTFVVMPVILSKKEQGLEYLERLQKYYLANGQANLYFALLTDYSDATDREMPEDETIKDALIRRVNELNEKYPSEHSRFSLFIRYRNWNESEGCYMGWERKRGKLEEFNALLCGVKEEDTSFSTILTDREIINTYKYVITLDADSNLIRDNAAKMVGLIDHPINRAVIDPTTRKVIDGYVIIQPSVRNHIVDKNSSLFPRVFIGQTGINNYSMVTSDVYQDVFQQGTYTGKGIYNVEAFHNLLHKKIPENSVLSHDLLESCYARTAFASTVNIMDNFPGSVLSYAQREHRWIRGDWQLLPWLFHRRNLSGISRWKILDNLRRSFIPLSKTLFILLNLIFLPRISCLWIPIVLFSDLFGIILLLSGVIAQKFRRPKLALIHRKFWKEFWTMIQRTGIELTITPYKAYNSTDAILRTLYRIFVSKKSLLKWKTSDTVEKSIQNTKKGYFLNMWTSLIPAILLVLLLMVQEISLLGIIGYSLVAASWILAFLLAYAISQPTETQVEKNLIDPDGLLIDSSRRMWQFFRDFSVKENNWLCPDNYQMTGKEKVTSKTSPTNIGLQLLSILSARDMGFETLSSITEMINNVIESVVELPKYKGHLYNWYNTKTLEVLPPEYISTVDSGNFIGDMVTLKNGLLEEKSKPLIHNQVLDELKRKLKIITAEVQLKENYATIGDFLQDIISIRDKLAAGDKNSWEDALMANELLRSIDLLEKEIVSLKLEKELFEDKPSLLKVANSDNKNAISLIDKLDGLCDTIDSILQNVDFRFLFNKKRLLFHIGYHVTSQTVDAGYYDLMASESALTSFLAIARGEVPLKHWYKLGRPLTLVSGIPTFVSWSGTMFEYLMPYLIMNGYDDSVYDESYRAAVLQQISYAKKNDIPWGISESQYFRFDLDANYQYRAFGVPGLRLQPSMSHSKVVAPYATMLALDYAKEEAISNLNKMKELGAYGKYGFYEAIDFNSPDPVNMTDYCVVRSFMAHHQGMSLVAINNFLNDGIMRSRFHAEPMVKATEVLLEEKRQSYFIAISKKGYTVTFDKIDIQQEDVLSLRYVKGVSPAIPVVNYLSNSNYSMMITSDGDGFSNCKGLMLYRWRSDLYANTGQYIYIKDVKEGKVWSSTYHPTNTIPQEYQVFFSTNKSEFKRRDDGVTTCTEITLSPNRNLEIRKVTFTNHTKEEKQLEVTSYLEVVGDTFLAEMSHPAFNKLFIESEFIEGHNIFLSRRRSSKSGVNPTIMHMVKTGCRQFNSIEYENDRLRFIGRNNTLQNPEAIDSISLSNNTGFSNDPIISLRVRITLGAEETCSLSFITGICNDKEEAIRISDKLSVPYRIEDIFEKFRLQSEMELKYLGITRQQVNAFQDIISPLYYPNAHYRGPSENIRRNWKNQSFLWRFGVSGDHPIMLLRVDSIEEAGIIKDVLKAYEYLRINQVKVDLIILSEAKHGYLQELTDLLNDMISSLKIYDEDRSKPSLFILHTYQMIPAEIDLLFTVARVVFSKKTGIYFRNIKEYHTETITKQLE